ncbi:hypothetical protein pb186bvf_011832 [Paramecium bursaria]
MKSIVNTSQQIDGQDSISLQTIQTYYHFINDYQKFQRKRISIDLETKELYKSIHEKFIDQIIFDKVKSNWNQKMILQFNSLIYLFDHKIEQNQLEEINEIMQKIVETAQVLVNHLDETQKLQVAILATYQMGFFLNIGGFYKDSVDNLNKTIDIIQDYRKSPKQQQDAQIFFTTDEEWLFLNELKTLRLLADNYGKLNQHKMCIEYQDKTLQHVKSHEGITQEYIYTLYNFNNEFAQLDHYRQLKLIDETCRDLEMSKEYFFLQFQKLKILYHLEQQTKQEYDRIINLHQKIQIKDDNFNIVFHSVILQSAIRLKLYPEINQQIDIMFSYITTISDKKLETIVGQRRSLYLEFQNKNIEVDRYEQVWAVLVSEKARGELKAFSRITFIIQYNKEYGLKN